MYTRYLCKYIRIRVYTWVIYNVAIYINTIVLIYMYMYICMAFHKSDNIYIYNM